MVYVDMPTWHGNCLMIPSSQCLLGIANKKLLTALMVHDLKKIMGMVFNNNENDTIIPALF